MDPFDLERKVTLQWGGRTSSVARSERKTVGIEEVHAAIRSAAIVFWGDDRTVPSDQERWVALQRGESTFNVLLTDRPQGGDAVLLRWASRNDVRVRRLLTKTGRAVSDRKLYSVAKRMARDGRRILIWTGALRLSPAGFPSHMMRADPRVLFLRARDEQLRWKLRLDDRWIRTGPRHYSYLGASPLEAMESFRLQDVEERARLQTEELEPFFFEFVVQVARRLEASRPPRPRQVLHPFSIRGFQVLARERPRSRVFRFLWDRLLRGESGVLPKERWVLLSSLERAHVAEEAAHYVRLANGEGSTFGPARTVVEEAFAFMASCWVDPARKVPRGSREHAAWEKAHRMGYHLGRRLFELWRERPRTRSKIREAWSVQLKGERDSVLLWKQLEDLR